MNGRTAPHPGQYGDCGRTQQYKGQQLGHDWREGDDRAVCVGVSLHNGWGVRRKGGISTQGVHRGKHEEGYIGGGDKQGQDTTG